MHHSPLLIILLLALYQVNTTPSPYHAYSGIQVGVKKEWLKDVADQGIESFAGFLKYAHLSIPEVHHDTGFLIFKGVTKISGARVQNVIFTEINGGNYSLEGMSFNYTNTNLGIIEMDLAFNWEHTYMGAVLFAGSGLAKCMSSRIHISQLFTEYGKIDSLLDITWSPGVISVKGFTGREAFYNDKLGVLLGESMLPTVTAEFEKQQAHIFTEGITKVFEAYATYPVRDFPNWPLHMTFDHVLQRIEVSKGTGKPQLIISFGTRILNPYETVIVSAETESEAQYSDPETYLEVCYSRQNYLALLQLLGPARYFMHTYRAEDLGEFSFALSPQFVTDIFPEIGDSLQWDGELLATCNLAEDPVLFAMDPGAADLPHLGIIHAPWYCRVVAEEGAQVLSTISFQVDYTFGDKPYNTAKDGMFLMPQIEGLQIVQIHADNLFNFGGQLRLRPVLEEFINEMETVNEGLLSPGVPVIQTNTHVTVGKFDFYRNEMCVQYVEES